jgi:tRNA 2-selenouridine synthase
MLNEINIEEFLLLDKAIAVDVRSPIEFEEGAIPGAINIPLFSNEERAQIGTIYKQNGQEAAKWRAMEIVSPKIPLIMHQLKSYHDKGYTPVINCWRGGMRSKSVCTFMEFSGLPSLRLTGGYKAYRQFALDKISELFPEKAVVVHGKTGIGKTQVLHQLQAKGYPVLDLEALAGHRGSIFGSIGLGEGYNQKTFDSLLFHALLQIKDAPYFIIEAESKRIGRAIQPEELLLKKENGFHLYLDASLSRRVQLIYDEYVKPYAHESWFKEKVETAITKIGKRISSIQKKNELKLFLHEEKWDALIQVLLEDYYDPRYDHKRSEYSGNFYPIDAENIEMAVEEIEHFIMKKFASVSSRE